MADDRVRESGTVLEPSRIPAHWPELPRNVNRTTTIDTIDGTPRNFTIEAEIIIPQSDSKQKIIVLQKMRHREKNQVQFRFGYYMIGGKGKSKGRWVWGQYALFILQNDLEALLNEASRKKWFTR